MHALFEENGCILLRGMYKVLSKWLEGCFWRGRSSTLSELIYKLNTFLIKLPVEFFGTCEMILKFNWKNMLMNSQKLLFLKKNNVPTRL